MERVFDSHNKRVIDAIFMVIFDWTRWFEKCVCVCVLEFTCVRHSCTQPPWMSSHESILLSIFYIRLREWFVSNDFLFSTKTTTLYRQINIIQHLWARCDNLRNVLCILGVNFTVYRAQVKPIETNPFDAISWSNHFIFIS